MFGTSITPPSDRKHKFSTNIPPARPWQPPWKTTMDSTPPDSVQIPCNSVQWVRLPCIYDNAGVLSSYYSSHITCMTGTTHTSNQPRQANFDNDKVYIVIDINCSVTMWHPKQDFVEPLKKYDALSTDFRVQRCTRFMRASSLVPLMTVLVILVG